MVRDLTRLSAASGSMVTAVGGEDNGCEAAGDRRRWRVETAGQGCVV